MQTKEHNQHIPSTTNTTGYKKKPVTRLPNYTCNLELYTIIFTLFVNTIFITIMVWKGNSIIIWTTNDKT